MTSNLGIQLYRVNLCNWQTYLNLLTNILLNVIMLYVSIALDPYYLESMPTLFSKLLNQKPLILSMVYWNVVLFYPLEYVICQVHFNIFGRQLVELLDSPCFQEVFNWRRITAKCTALTIVLLNLILFTVFYFDTFYLDKHWPGFTDLLRILCCLVIFSQFYFIFGAILYFQFATNSSLKALLKSNNYNSHKSICKFFCNIF